MLVEVHEAYADTRAADLSWSIERPELAPLASLDVVDPLDGRRLRLGILGASHQVVLVDPAGVETCRETVACLTDRATGLPSRAERRVGTGHYRFTARVETAVPARFPAHVTEVCAELDGDPRALVAHFPGVPHAVTAVRAWLGHDTASWTTWHTYPQAGEIVITETVLSSAATAEPDDAMVGVGGSA